MWRLCYPGSGKMIVTNIPDNRPNEESGKASFFREKVVRAAGFEPATPTV
jgi:hypothetical protein